MKKLFLLLITLISMSLAHAMENEQLTLQLSFLRTESGHIAKIDHRTLSPQLRSPLIQYSFINQQNTKSITVDYDIKNQQYSGMIEDDQAGFQAMQDQAEIKTTFEKLEAEFDAIHNKNKSN